MSSLYAMYVQEKTNDLILERKEGFATYRYLNEYQVYIVDIFVASGFRNQGIASSIANEIVQKAKDQGCTELIGTVIPSNKDSNESLKILMSYGLKLQSCSENMIILKKDI